MIIARIAIVWTILMFLTFGLWLLLDDEDAGWVTGQVFGIDGGLSTLNGR